MVQQRAPCQAVSTSPQSGSGTPACSASRDGIASQVREADERAGTPLLSCAPTSCRCFVAEWLICRAVTVVSVQLPDSVLHICGVSLFCFFFFYLCRRSSSKVLSIRPLWNIYLRYTSVIQKRKVVDHFCEFSLRDNNFFV